MDGLTLHERSPVSSSRQRLSSSRYGATSSQGSARGDLAPFPSSSPSHSRRHISIDGTGSFAIPNPNIISPQPRRHHLLESASQGWMQTPPLSPVSSRGFSPAPSTQLLSSSSSSRQGAWPRKHQSFGSMHGIYEASSPGGASRGEKKATVDQNVGLGRRWIRWMDKHGLKSWVVPFALVFATLLKSCISLGSYSGQGIPPMYGDYEAQRHWMELTLHLPPKEWYKYDLQYWGLDYPPLTAYVSWLCGIFAHAINPSWVALDSSRGIETATSKVFMRATVLVCDLLIYIPALVMFAYVWQGTRSRHTQNMALVSLLIQPALLLVDFGHFQYNSVMLGLTLFSINCFAIEQDLLGAFCFVLSLGFKQMSLYYAPAIGTYLLAKCIYLDTAKGISHFIKLGLVTAVALIALFIPFLPPFAPLTTVIDPITRVFPFNRGLFEDKVANFWCASNVVIKWRSWASPSNLVKLSTLFTATGFLPSVFILLKSGIALRGTKAPQTPLLPLLPYALLNSSMSFFLFSFQVHEKTILLPLLPLSLLSSGASPDSPTHIWGALVNNVAMFSMWPLFEKDGLHIQYAAMLVLWNRIVGHNPLKFNKSFVQILASGFYAAALSLHILEIFIVPPARYPDLFPVLNVLISTPVFVLAWLWSIRRIIEASWAIHGLSSKHEQGQESIRKSTSSTPISAVSDKLEVPISDRVKGVRTTSLGFAHVRGRQRIPFRERAASIGPDGSSSATR